MIARSDAQSGSTDHLRTMQFSSRLIFFTETCNIINLLEIKIVILLVIFFLIITSVLMAVCYGFLLTFAPSCAMAASLWKASKHLGNLPNLCFCGIIMTMILTLIVNCIVSEINFYPYFSCGASCITAVRYSCSFNGLAKRPFWYRLSIFIYFQKIVTEMQKKSGKTKSLI